PTFTPLDGFETGSRAAIAGGVTTVLSMVYQEEGSLRRGIERGMRDAEASGCDFAFHVVVIDPSAEAIAELAPLAREGHAGVKVFMVTKRFLERKNDYLTLYKAAGKHGVLVAVHAEDFLLIERSTAALHLAGRTGAQHFPASRPVEAEVLATRAAIENAAARGALRRDAPAVSLPHARPVLYAGGSALHRPAATAREGRHVCRVARARRWDLRHGRDGPLPAPEDRQARAGSHIRQDPARRREPRDAAPNALLRRSVQGAAHR